MKRNKNYVLAKIVSRVFDLPIAILVTFSLIYSRISDSDRLPNSYYLFSLLNLLVIPIIFILILLKLNILDNWELTDRKNRKYVYLIGFISICNLIFITLIADIPYLYTKYLLLALIILVIYGGITEFTKYKLSIHIASWTAVLFILVVEYSPLYIILFPILIVIGIARLTIKNHTIQELILGGLLIFFILSTFSLLTKYF